jgi:predicted dienelactone hydrolase
MRLPRFSVLALGCLAFAAALAADPPSRTAIDAPELARLGAAPVGVRTLTLVNHDQPDPLAFDAKSGTAPLRDRTLVVDVWYPARDAGGAFETYSAELPSEGSAPPAKFTIPGIAVRGAQPAAGRHALVVVSHGYSNATVALSWLTENLASKGYVVAAIRHEDPTIGDRTQFAGPLLRRPIDIAFVASSLQASLGAEGLVDPARTALIGYSMGGYGVLTAGGGILDPDGPAIRQLVPGGLMAPFARGGARQDDIVVKGLRAIVALAPAGGGALNAWGRDGLAGIHAPLLLIAGDHDRTVDYASGARAFLEAATSVRRYLLTYRGGGHAIGLNSAPDAMRSNLWDLSWFEDPVWRKDRIIAINLHMITAFLDRYVRDDESRAAYLDVAVPDSNAAVWPAEEAGRFDTVSPATGSITVWKGFQRNFATNLELLRRDPAPVH